MNSWVEDREDLKKHKTNKVNPEISHYACISLNSQYSVYTFQQYYIPSPTAAAGRELVTRGSRKMAPFNSFLSTFSPSRATKTGASTNKCQLIFGGTWKERKKKKKDKPTPTFSISTPDRILPLLYTLQFGKESLIPDVISINEAGQQNSNG